MILTGIGEPSMFRQCLPMFVFVVSQMFTVDLVAVEYSGQIQIIEKGKAATSKEYADAVIYFLPETSAIDIAPAPEALEMRMARKSFSPRVLTITMGSTVTFPNYDPILHNAFSTTNKNSFDLGFYSGGESKTHIFENPGLVRVYCNVHHSMVGYILVLNTPYYTSPDVDGLFRLEDLPAERGKLYIWHPRAKVIREIIDLSQADKLTKNFELNLTKRRIPKHMNKLGKSYRSKRERRY